jgi:HK97 family phage prohead protease
MPDRLESYGYVREIDPEARRVTTVVSTGDVARDGMVIEVDGWDLRQYERNPVVLWAHDDRSLPIARAVSTERAGDVLMQTHEFAQHPRAEEVWTAVRDGFVNATSVRWTPGETEVRDMPDKRKVLVFTKGHELLEVSYVPVPADPGALVLRAETGAVVTVADYIPTEGTPADSADDAARLERLTTLVEATTLQLNGGKR